MNQGAKYSLSGAWKLEKILVGSFWEAFGGCIYTMLIKLLVKLIPASC